MTVLLFGHTGFIGQAIFNVLCHIHTIKTLPSDLLDFNSPDIIDNLADDFFDELFDGIDVVINAVGVMGNDERMENIHHHTPKRLARIAKEQGVALWINISAIGADDTHPIGFLGSKGRGDTAMIALADECFKVAIVRPSLVFGKGGASTGLFLRLARLPFWVLPNGGAFMIQPVHVNDVAQGILQLINTHKHGVFYFVNSPILLKDYLLILSNNFYQKRPIFILPIPLTLAKLFLTSIHFLFNNSLLNPDNLTLLQHNLIVNGDEFAAILGRNPVAVADFCFD